MDTETATSVDISRTISAFEGGEIGLGVGLILMIIVGFLRRTRFTGALDSTAAPIAVSVIGLVSVFAEELVRTGAWGPALIRGLTVGVPPILNLFVRPNSPKS